MRFPACLCQHDTENMEVGGLLQFHTFDSLHAYVCYLPCSPFPCATKGIGKSIRRLFI